MKILKTYIYIFSLLFLLHINVFGQSVGIAPSSLTITPNFTVLNTGTIAVLGDFKNTGTVSLTGTVTVNMAINTSTNTTPNYVFRNSSSYTVSAFSPLATKAFYVQDNASATNQYKVNGSGTTVVVWPVFNGTTSTTSDSAFTSIIVIMPNFINEYNTFENEILKISNPISQNIVLVYNELTYKVVELLNINGQVVQIINDHTLKVELLSKGLYYLNYYNSKTNKIITKKIVIE